VLEIQLQPLVGNFQEQKSSGTQDLFTNPFMFLFLVTFFVVTTFSSNVFDLPLWEYKEDFHLHLLIKITLQNSAFVLFNGFHPEGESHHHLVMTNCPLA